MNYSKLSILAAELSHEEIVTILAMQLGDVIEERESEHGDFSDVETIVETQTQYKNISCDIIAQRHLLDCPF